MCDVQFLSSVNGILCYSGQKKLFFFVFFFYPEHQIHQQSLWILLPQYLINLPTSFTKITVVYITIIFIWTTEIAIKLIFLHIFSLSSNQFFLQCSYWTFQMANLVTLYSWKNLSVASTTLRIKTKLFHMSYKGRQGLVSLSSII